MELAEYLIPWAKPCHVLANRFNLPCQIGTQNAGFWFEQPGRNTREVRQACHEMPVMGIHRSGADPHQHLIILDHRLVDILEFQDIIR